MTLERWKTVSSVSEECSGIFTFRRNQSVSPRNGRKFEFVVLDTPDWVSVVAFTRQGELVLVRQYRHGLDDFTLEVPGGIVDEGLTPEEGGRAELEQESGYRGGSWSLLGMVSAVPSILTNHVHVYLALGVEPRGEMHLDESEDIQVELLPFAQVRRMVAAGEILNAPVIASLYLYELWREREGYAPLGV